MTDQMMHVQLIALDFHSSAKQPAGGRGRPKCQC